MAVRLEGAEGIKRLFTRGSDREKAKRSTDAQMEYQKSRATADKNATAQRTAARRAATSPARTRLAGQMEMEANADNDTRRSPAKSAPKAPTRGTAPAKPSSGMTFKQAFAAARKAGKGIFTWNGKKYTTELAKPAPKAGSTPSRGTPGGVRGRGKK